jgi:hypothetical protein
MSSRPRRLAVLAVTTTLAAATGTAQAAPAQPSTPAQQSPHWVVVPETDAVTPPANVTAFAKDLGVDSDFAWKTLDELARTSGRRTASVRTAAGPAHPTPAPDRR